MQVCVGRGSRCSPVERDPGRRDVFGGADALVCPDGGYCRSLLVLGQLVSECQRSDSTAGPSKERPRDISSCPPVFPQAVPILTAACRVIAPAEQQSDR